jgi:thioredoxin 1
MRQNASASHVRRRVLDITPVRAIIGLADVALTSSQCPWCFTIGEGNMGSLQQVDQSDFQEVLDSSHTIPVLVDFFAEWCPPCRKLGPTLEELAGELEGRLRIVKINVDTSPLASKYGVMNIPTMILFKNGEEVSRLVGNQAKRSLEKEVEPYLAPPAA